MRFNVRVNKMTQRAFTQYLLSPKALLLCTDDTNKQELIEILIVHATEETLRGDYREPWSRQEGKWLT